MHSTFLIKLQPAPVALMVASQYALSGFGDRRGLGSKPSLARSLMSDYSGVYFEINISGRHRGFVSVLVKL